MPQTPESLYARLGYRDWDKLSPHEKVERMLRMHAGEHKDKDSFSNALSHGTPETAPLKILSVSTPTPTTSTVTFSYTLPAFYANALGNLHGAAHALIYDNCTTLALAAISKPGFWMLGGVSRVLDVKYLRAISVGEQVTIQCEVMHAGGRAAALRGVLMDSKGRVCSTCEHDKTNVDPPTSKSKESKL